MSGNLCVATKHKNRMGLLQALRSVFPQLDKNWDEFMDKSSGNHVRDPRTGETIKGIGIKGTYGGVNGGEAHTRIPKKYTGMTFDMGLKWDPKTGCWSEVVWDEDRRKFMKQLAKAENDVVREEVNKDLSKVGGRLTTTGQVVDISSAPQSLQMLAQEGAICYEQECEMTVEELIKAGIKIEL